LLETCLYQIWKESFDIYTGWLKINENVFIASKITASSILFHFQNYTEKLDSNL